MVVPYKAFAKSGIHNGTAGFEASLSRQWVSTTKVEIKYT
jgi:hypothetical protein